TTLDQSDFLALMTAQLKNQDPTKPVDNAEYVSQLAQFSAVTGISQTNTAIGATNTAIQATNARLDAILARLDALAPATSKGD
ncbi:MAG: flagellar hook assembly protein FlgD, partial [Polymorphobacter sp.]